MPRSSSPAPIRRGEGAPCPLRRKNVARAAVCSTHSGAVTGAIATQHGYERIDLVATLAEGRRLLGLDGQHARALGEVLCHAWAHHEARQLAHPCFKPLQGCADVLSVQVRGWVYRELRSTLVAFEPCWWAAPTPQRAVLPLMLSFSTALSLSQAMEHCRQRQCYTQQHCPKRCPAFSSMGTTTAVAAAATAFVQPHAHAAGVKSAFCGSGQNSALVRATKPRYSNGPFYVDHTTT